MSLLQKKIEGYEFSYQLPLGFEDQLDIVSKSISFYSYEQIKTENGSEMISMPNLIKIWEFIKKDIEIKKDDKIVYEHGMPKENLPKNILKLTILASKFFSDEFKAFMKEEGI